MIYIHTGWMLRLVLIYAMSILYFTINEYNKINGSHWTSKPFASVNVLLKLAPSKLKWRKEGSAFFPLVFPFLLSVFQGHDWASKLDVEVRQCIWSWFYFLCYIVLNIFLDMTVNYQRFVNQFGIKFRDHHRMLLCRNT